MEFINSSYNSIALNEINRRGSKITITDVLEDSIHHAFIIGHGGNVESAIYNSIAKGYKDFNKFVADLSFDENQAIIAAAKTAYLCNVILTTGKILKKYSDDINMEHWNIEDKELINFNNYKYSNPEAFYYWYNTLLQTNRMVRR